MYIQGWKLNGFVRDQRSPNPHIRPEDGRMEDLSFVLLTSVKEPGTVVIIKRGFCFMSFLFALASRNYLGQ